MGDTLSTPSTNLEEFSLENTIEYEESTNEQFGPILIFRQNRKPYRYFLRYREIAVDDPKTYERLKQKEEWFRGFGEHRNIVKVERAMVFRSTEMCIKNVGLDLFASYYNYTLQKAVESKIRRNVRFRETDILYVLESLISALSEFRNKSNSYSGWFTQLTHVYLSPEGFVKIYPFPMYFKSMNNISQRSMSIKPIRPKNYIVDNEEVELELTKKTSEGSKLSFDSQMYIPMKQSYEDDIRDIGVLVLRLLLLNRDGDIRFYTPDKLKQLLDMLYFDRTITHYLKNLLEKMLLYSRSISLADLQKTMESLKDQDVSFGHCVKIDEGPSLPEPPSLSNKLSAEQQIAMHQNLKASTINVISRLRRGNSAF